MQPGKSRNTFPSGVNCQRKRVFETMQIQEGNILKSSFWPEEVRSDCESHKELFRA